MIVEKMVFSVSSSKKGMLFPQVTTKTVKQGASFLGI
jgi:hypothetical protein